MSAGEPHLFGQTGHPAMKWPDCPQYKHALVESLLCLSERVSLAWSGCMGSLTEAGGDGEDCSSRESTGRPLEVVKWEEKNA